MKVKFSKGPQQCRQRFNLEYIVYSTHTCPTLRKGSGSGSTPWYKWSTVWGSTTMLQASSANFLCPSDHPGWPNATATPVCGKCGKSIILPYSNEVFNFHHCCLTIPQSIWLEKYLKSVSVPFLKFEQNEEKQDYFCTNSPLFCKDYYLHVFSFLLLPFFNHKKYLKMFCFVWY